MSEINMKNDKNLKRKQDRKDLVRFAVETLETAKDFQLISALGRGTYGDVYKMFDPEREADIAIKIVTPENTVDLESTLWPELEHPNIVPLLEILTLSPIDVTVFVMPVQQRSLHDVLNDKYFLKRGGGFIQVKEWMFEVLCALEYISSKNLCHLDIKVDNILISKKKIAMLCDFSFLNTTVAPLNRHALGLPYIYRPPEVCRTLEEEVCVDGAAYDMWGYGTMIVEVLTHFVIASKVQECDCWMYDVYPILFNALQEEEFANLITKAFPADVIEEIDMDLALDFIHSFLVTECLQRASPVSAKKHLFLNHGYETGSGKDDIWIRKVDISSSTERILKVSSTDSNNAGDAKTDSGSDYNDTDSGYSIRDSCSDLSYSDSEIFLVPFQIKYGTVVDSLTRIQGYEEKESLKQSSNHGQRELFSKESSMCSQDDTERNHTTEISSDKSNRIDFISLYETRQVATADQDGFNGPSLSGVESSSLKLKKQQDTPKVRFRDTSIATSDQDNFSGSSSIGIESFSLDLKKQHDTPKVRFCDTPPIATSDQNNFSGPSSTGVESFPLKFKKRRGTPKVRFGEHGILNSFRNDGTQAVPKSFFTNLDSGAETANDETEDSKMTLICVETHKDRQQKNQFMNNQLEFQLMRRENIQITNAKTTTKTASSEFSGNTVDPKRSSSSILENKRRAYAMYSETVKAIATQDAFQSFGTDSSNMKWTEETALNRCRGKFYKMAETKFIWTTREFLKICEDESPFMEEKEIPLTSQLMSELSMNESTNIHKDIGFRIALDVLPETRTLGETSKVIDKLQKTLTPENCLRKEKNTHTCCSYDSLAAAWAVPVENGLTSMNDLGHNEEFINFQFQTMLFSNNRGNASVQMKGDNSTDQKPLDISFSDDFNEMDLIVDLKTSSKELSSFESDTWIREVIKSNLNVLS